VWLWKRGSVSLFDTSEGKRKRKGGGQRGNQQWWGEMGMIHQWVALKESQYSHAFF